MKSNDTTVVTIPLITVLMLGGSWDVVTRGIRKAIIPITIYDSS